MATYPLPPVPTAEAPPGHDARRLCLRMMVDAIDQTAAEGLDIALMSTLHAHTVDGLETIQRYPKFEACYEITLTLPASVARSVLSICPDGWMDADFAGDGSAVWNRREARYFVLPQVRWAELYWRDDSPLT